MEYVFLAISCTFFSVQFIFNKYYEKYSDGSYAAGLWCALVNALVMLVYLLPANGFRMALSVSAVICSLTYAVSSLLCTGVTLIAMGRGKLSVVTTYTLLGGFVLPFVWGLIAYDEEMTFLKGFGMVLIILSIVGSLLLELLTEPKKGTEKRSSPIGFHLLCMVLFITNGVISVATTASQKASDAVGSDEFLLLCLAEIAVFAFLLLLIHGISRQSKGEKHGVRNAFLEIAENPPMTWKLLLMLVLFCALYSVCNGIGNIFSLNCAQTMDASIQFPLSSAVMILMSALISFLFFREKPERNDWIRLLLAAAGTVCFIL